MGSTNTFAASLTNNGVTIPSAFDFVLDPKTTPSSAYLYTIGDNSCSIKGLKYPYSMILSCYLRSDHAIKDSVSINLKGTM